MTRRSRRSRVPWRQPDAAQGWAEPGPTAVRATSAGGAGSVDPVEKARFGDDAIVERRVIAWLIPESITTTAETSTGAALRIDDIGLAPRRSTHRVRRWSGPAIGVPLDHAALLGKLGESFGALSRPLSARRGGRVDRTMSTSALEKRDGAGRHGATSVALNERVFLACSPASLTPIGAATSPATNTENMAMTDGRFRRCMRVLDDLDLPARRRTQRVIDNSSN